MRFFSQNDPKWKNSKIGASSLRLGDFGCTTSCIADASSFFGEVKTPLELSKSPLYTPSGLVLWQNIGKIFKTFEFEWRFYSYDIVRINAALADPDKVVLLNINHGKHWVFLVGAYVPNVGYAVSDPWSYPASRKHYNNIVGGVILRRKK